jgi:ribokinase
VAAVQLARLAGTSTMFTALGDDAIAERSRERLAELGVSLEVATRDGPTRRAFTFVDSHGERTITTIGERLEPRDADALDWESLDGADAVYLTAGDPDAIRAARRARVLVASPRAGRALAESGVELDALVFSDLDELESAFAAALDPRPKLLVATRGAEGGRYETAEGGSDTWDPVAPPGPIVDSYGSGDSFAAAFTYGLGAGGGIEEALRQGAEAGAACLTRNGPYG